MINKISIIIPIYNVEKYLPKCLDSILSWDFKNWEAILINDGSADNSGKICDQYAMKEHRFHVIHQKNQGVSSARNAGLEKANGEWIMFIDADDWVDGNLLFKQIENLNLEDIQSILFGICIDNGNESYNILPKNENYSLSHETSKLPYYGSLGFCNLIYRRNLIEQLHLRFSTNLKMGEDMEFMMKYHVKVQNIITIPFPIYHYIRREGSATTNSQAARRTALDHLLFLKNVLAWTKDYNKELPKWFKACLQLEIKTGLQMVYRADFTYKECQMYSRHFKQIDNEWRNLGYNFFNTPLFQIAKFNVYLYKLLLQLKYKRL